MSIINDALKKVQKSLRHSSSPHQLPVSDQPSPAEEIRPHTRDAEMLDKYSNLVETKPRSAFPFVRNHGLRDTIILLMCFAVCAGLFFLILFLFRQNSPGPASVPALRPAAVRKAPTQRTPKLKTVAPSDQVIVTGIMEMGNTNMALINNEIYEVGDTINGAKIMAIEMDRVEIMKDGNIEVLRVHEKN